MDLKDRSDRLAGAERLGRHPLAPVGTMPDTRPAPPPPAATSAVLARCAGSAGPARRPRYHRVRPARTPSASAWSSGAPRRSSPTGRWCRATARATRTLLGGQAESWTGRLAAAESAFVRLADERPDDEDSRLALADAALARGPVRRSLGGGPGVLRRAAGRPARHPWGYPRPRRPVAATALAWCGDGAGEIPAHRVLMARECASPPGGCCSPTGCGCFARLEEAAAESRLAARCGARGC
jgi:hypothetical protein